MSSPSQWIRRPASKESILRAQVMREERDRKYRNLFPEESTDMRWTGELGEIAFDNWLGIHGIKHTWVTANPAGLPDFFLPSRTADIKVAKRKAKPLADYTMQISEKHARENVDDFFFMSYDFKEEVMWFLGGISREDFMNSARYYGPGEYVHAKYRIREGGEIYNIPIAELIPPYEWLSDCKGS